MSIPETRTKKSAMINPKRFAQLARKWQRIKTTAAEDEKACCTTSPLADKGHSIIDTADGRWFEVPLAYRRRRLLASS
jgi:hypothetical protein